MGRNIATDILGIVERKPTINAKEKGNVNELALCKLLSKWTGANFNRTPGSGGLRWVEASLIAGDVVAPVGFHFPLTVETKHLASLHVTKYLRSNSEIYTIWRQASRDGARVNRVPIAFIRKNRMPANRYYVFMALEHLNPDWFLWATEICRGVCDGQTIVGFMSEAVLGIPYKDFLTFLSLPNSSDNG